MAADGVVASGATGRPDAAAIAGEAGGDDESAFQFGIGVEAAFETLTNVSLGRESRDHVLDAEEELLLEVSYDAGGRLSGCAELALIAEQERDADANSGTAEGAERGETWLQLRTAGARGPSLRVGRLSFEDRRRWWWDDDLDAVKIGYAADSSDIWVAAAEELAPESTIDGSVDPEARDVFRVLAAANWDVTRSLTLAAFYLRQEDRSRTPRAGVSVPPEDEDESDADLNWAGLRALGAWNAGAHGTIAYWADAAVVHGREVALEFEDDGGRNRVESSTRRRIRGWAVDVGGTWTLAVPTRPSVTLSHARTSADEHPDDDIERTFRQTGLQDPDQERRLYGELLRPELSNLAITTAAVSFEVLDDSTVSLGYHRFRQVRAAPFLRDSRLEAEPSGDDPDLGGEVRLVIMLREWEATEIELAGASFFAGRAFGSAEGERANSAFVQITHEF